MRYSFRMCSYLLHPQLLLLLPVLRLHLQYARSLRWSLPTAGMNKCMALQIFSQCLLIAMPFSTDDSWLGCVQLLELCTPRQIVFFLVYAASRASPTYSWALQPSSAW